MLEDLTFPYPHSIVEIDTPILLLLLSGNSSPGIIMSYKVLFCLGQSTSRSSWPPLINAVEEL
ncbi:uncharacterized protein J3R85_019746 [Psidium guajava]|nr:uncharacterized protein J3R85_019746 [Psidium guajava]